MQFLLVSQPPGAYTASWIFATGFLSRRDDTSQQPEGTCLHMSTNPPVASQMKEALPQLMLLHLMSMATPHCSVIISDIASVSPTPEHMESGATLPFPCFGKLSPSELGQGRRKHLESRLGGFTSSLKKRLQNYTTR